MVNSDAKIDRILALLEKQELCAKQSQLRDILINTILASVVGYFIFRILDAHLRGRVKY